MRKIYLTFSFVIASGLLSAQNKDTKIADKLFDRYEYVDAAQEYLKLAQSGKADAYVYKQLADSYYAIFNSKEAIKWYAKAVAQKQDAETYYKYAQMLKAEGNFKEADKQMQQFAQLAPNDQRAKTFVNNPNYLPELHAIECRINAEDPYNDFRPSPGKITTLHMPGGHGVRLDTHVYSGYSIPPNYDSMIAKLITTAQSREEAISKMRRALDEFVIEGVKTTIPFHRQLMDDPKYIAGDYTTAFMDTFKMKELE